ncbi:hypothetical protein POM88_050280 [Heracleum sosnowskyi]|uniref:Reverse transcriptase zinc-binding domain-containing protein n=1 Tax=Heracleum sosnowskyi TaxID=360622 RepID=A0AAD8GYH5_9APIA|nr:hypothetical protein POM88_050280 [Heracleum sosnowskyi]
MVTPTDCSWILKKVLSLRTLARRFLSFQIGNGVDFSLWFDPWWNNTCLASKNGDPIISQAYSNQQSSVNSLIHTGRWIMPTINSRRHHLSTILQSWLHDFVPPSFDLEKRDLILWENTHLHKIRTGHIWDAIRFKLPEVPWHDLIWHNHYVLCALAAILNISVPSTWLDLITNWGSHPSLGHHGIALLTAQVFSYHIWRERNARLHNKGCFGPLKIIE